jgi:uncharacterized protein (DUF2141 family)
MLVFQCLMLFNLMLSGGDLKVKLSNVGSSGGQILMAIYDTPEGYMNTKKAIMLKTIPITGNQPVEVVFPGLKQGEYAITVVHDLNNNGKIDANLFGVPVEPYGFSNNIRPKFRSASWMESKFYFKDSNTVVALKLDTW